MKTTHILLILFSILSTGLMLGCIGSSSSEQNNNIVVMPGGGMTGTWVSSTPANGVAIAPVEDPAQIYHYDLEMNLTQQGSQSIGMVALTLRKIPSQAPELEASLNTTVSSSVVINIDGSNIKFNIGLMQFTGTFDANSMSGTVTEHQPSASTNSGSSGTLTASQSNMDWNGTFNLHKV